MPSTKATIISRQIHTAWNEILKISNRIIHLAKHYGFLTISEIPEPDIHNLLRALDEHSDFFDDLIESPALGDLDHTDVRMVLCAREQIRRMQNVTLALNESDQLGFEQAIIVLGQQAPY